ncbi:hypothetical protein COOONC_24324 [Cooperia oncophora]
MATYSYPTLVYNCRSAQLGCVSIQILVLYSNADSLGTFTFVFTVALCLYNLYVIGKRWYNNIDGRFDMRQMVREPDTPVKGVICCRSVHTSRNRSVSIHVGTFSRW